jgi:hypothetical protein
MKEGEPTICYGKDDDEFGGATFTRVCPLCNRYVKADKEVTFKGNGQPVSQPNAMCRVHGRVEMSFVGYC